MEIKNNSHHPWLRLQDIIDLNAWQRIQDNFSVVTGVCIRTVDSEGKPFTSTSNELSLFRKLSQTPEIGKEIYADCMPTFLGGKGVVDKNLSFACFPGMHNFVSPLKVNPNAPPLGYFIIGPVVLVGRLPKEKYLEMADRLGIDVEELWDMLLEVKVLSFQGAQSLVELIADVGEQTLKLAYKNIMQQKQLEPTLELPKLDRILNALLDVAFQISGADVGSVMFFNKTKKVLTINTSRGIPDDIVRKTRVKLGVGISGIALQEGKSLLINDDTQDDRIRPYLKRPALGSAMVLPLRADKKIVGVMNLGALKSSASRFNVESLNTMSRLVDLVGVAMT